jgi:hypothetical protein
MDSLTASLFIMTDCSRMQCYRPEDVSDLPELARILLKDGQFPGLDGVDTYELAQESVAAALEVVYERLDSSADAKRAETIMMPSTIVPAAAVPVNEGAHCLHASTRSFALQTRT